MRKLWICAGILLSLISLTASPVLEFPFRESGELKEWSRNRNASVTEGRLRFEQKEKVPSMQGIWKTLPLELLRGRLVRLTGERRGQDIQVPDRGYLGPKIMFVVRCGKRTLYPGVAGKFGTYDWEPFDTVFEIPESAEKVQLFLGFQNGTGVLELRNLKLSVAGVPLNLSHVANMEYTDSVERDGKGGWSDQGPGADGRCFRPGLQKRLFAGVPFAPGTKGKSILTMYSGYFRNGPKTVTIPLGKPEKARNLYLLHTLCYGPKRQDAVGGVEVEYADGKRERFPIRSAVEVGDWWNGNRFSNGAIGLQARSGDGEKRTLYVSRLKLNSTAPVKAVRFAAENPATLWIVCAATLSERDYELPRIKRKVRTTIAANKDWLPVAREDYNRRVKGSALDVSAFTDRRPAGSSGRVIIRDDGHFAFEKTPERIQRFFSAGVSLWDLSSRWKIDWLADELVKNGYNMVRIHIPEHFLMAGAGEKLRLNTHHLDLFDYLAFALKKRGIYLMCDMMGAQQHGWTPFKSKYWGSPLPDPSKRRARLAIHFDPEVRADWRNGVEQMICRVNPYTKTRLIDDPVLVMVLGFNEQEFEFSRSYFDREYAAPFYRAFLKRKYGTIEAYNRRWKTEFASFGEIPCFKLRETGNADVHEFLYETERSTAQWYRDQMRELGYKGLVASYNVFKTHHFNRIRSGENDYVAMNSYHAHPSNWIEGGSVVPQISAISRSAGLFRDILSARLHGKPHVVTEYQCVYWNRFRYEQPFVFGAYAAFQGLDAISMHSDPVSLQPMVFRNSRIVPFLGYTDPIAVASEFLTFFLYMRGDVKPVPDRVRVLVTEREQRTKNPNAVISKTQSSLALINGFSLVYDGKNDPSALFFAPKGEAKTEGTEAFSQTVDEAANLVPYLKIMKEKGFLPEKNRSNGLNLFESSTGELLMDTDRNFMAVNTPRLQGICAGAGTTYRLADFEIRGMSVPGNLSLVSVDGMKPVRDAKRLVLVFATNALSSGMVFAEEEMRTLVRGGGGPALLRAGEFQVRIRNRNAASLKLYPLDLAGNRLKEIRPSAVNGEFADFRVDTARDGAAVFFELSSR